MYKEIYIVILFQSKKRLLVYLMERLQREERGKEIRYFFIIINHTYIEKSQMHYLFHLIWHVRFSIMFDCEKAGIRNLDMEITQFIVQVSTPHISQLYRVFTLLDINPYENG